MKYFLLLLLCFNVNAKILKLEIVRNDGFKGSKRVTEAGYEKYIKRLIKHPKYKGKWESDPIGGIVSKEVNGSPVHYKPLNFTVTQEDITQEVNDKKDKKNARIARLKAVKNDPNTSQVIKDIIKVLINE